MQKKKKVRQPYTKHKNYFKTVHKPKCDSKNYKTVQIKQKGEAS